MQQDNTNTTTQIQNKSKKRKPHAWLLKNKKNNRYYSRYAKAFTTSKLFESFMFENRDSAREACSLFCYEFKPVKVYLSDKGFPVKLSE
jgi:hypothetical protein